VSAVETGAGAGRCLTTGTGGALRGSTGDLDGSTGGFSGFGGFEGFDGTMTAVHEARR
jgi:hypothetical protein